MNRRWRIAVAGLGAAARQIHLPAFAGLTGVEVVGGCDPVAPAGSFPFPVFATAAEMIDKTRPEVVAVVTPPAHHHALTRLALQAGCHVLCEKPFMPTLEEARDVAALSREVKRWVVVNNQYRFMNIHQAAKAHIGAADFGRLLFVNVQQSFFMTETTEAGWRGRDPQRTCKEFGTHVFDLCRFFFDEDPTAIAARMPRAGDPAAPDYLDLIQLEFSGDRVALITLDRLSRGPHRYLTIHLDGSVGCVETRLGGGIELHGGVRGGTRRPYLEADVSLGGRARLYHGERYRKIASDPLDVFAHATRRLVRALLDAVEKDQTPPCHAEDNLRTLALMMAAYESHEKRAPIEMRY